MVKESLRTFTFSFEVFRILLCKPSETQEFNLGTQHTSSEGSKASGTHQSSDNADTQMPDRELVRDVLFFKSSKPAFAVDPCSSSAPTSSRDVPDGVVSVFMSYT